MRGCINPDRRPNPATADIARNDYGVSRAPWKAPQALNSMCKYRCICYYLDCSQYIYVLSVYTLSLPWKLFFSSFQDSESLKLETESMPGSFQGKLSVYTYNHIMIPESNPQSESLCSFVGSLCNCPNRSMGSRRSNRYGRSIWPIRYEVD